MKRDFLKELGITDEETVKAVLDENGRDVAAVKVKLETAELEKTAASEALEAQTKELKALQESAGTSGELQQKIEAALAETEQYKAQLADRDYLDAVNKAIADSGVKFSSKAAEQVFVAGLKENRLKLKDGAPEGFEDYLSKVKTDDPSAFAEEKKAGNGMKFDTGAKLGGGEPDMSPESLSGALSERYQTKG